MSTPLVRGAGRPDRPLAVAGAAPAGYARARAGLELRRRRGRRGRAAARSSAGCDDGVARAVADDAAQARGAAAASTSSTTAPGCRARPTRWCSSDGRRLRATTPTSPARPPRCRERYDGPLEPRRSSAAGATAASRAAGAWPTWAAARRPLLVRDPAAGGGDRGRGRRRTPARPSVVGRLARATRADGDVLVSTIPADGPGRGGCCAGAPTCRVVFEVVYDPWPTPLAAAALAASRRWSAGSTCSSTRPRCRSS